MDISAISSAYKADAASISSATSATDDNGFSSILGGVMESLSETNALQNAADAETISFALGESDNVHDLLIAQQKANTALQYTVTVRNQLISGYNTIMNMQI